VVTQAVRDYEQAVYEFDAVVKRLAVSDWSRPSPCARWNVAQLVRHNAWGCFMFAEMTRGRPPAVPAHKAEPGARPAPLGGGFVWASHLLGFDGERFKQGGAEASRAWSERRDDLLQALDGCDPRQPTVSLWGHDTIDKAVEFAAVDPLVHTWDVARAVGWPVVIEDAIAERALRVYQDFERARSLRLPATLGPELHCDDPSPVVRLVAYTGRDPGWGLPSLP
jgi:uncharacterized protein (TIGR03083 family)